MEITIVAVIPAFNEVSTISRVIVGVKKYIETVIVVDDGSSDDTAKIAKREGAIVVSNRINMGYDKSIDVGIKRALQEKVSAVLTIDADSQHMPSDIPRFIDFLRSKEADVVVGNRLKKARLIEYVFSAYANWKIGVADPICGLKLIRIETYNMVGYFDKIGSFGAQILFDASRKGAVVKEVDIDVIDRNDESRVGGIVVANFKLLRGFLKLVLHDLKGD